MNRQERVDGPGKQRRGRPEQENWGETVDEIPADVDERTFLKQLARSNGEEVLKRREERDQDHKPNARSQSLHEIGKHVVMRRQEDREGFHQ